MAYCGYLRKSRVDLEAEQQGMGETLARHRKALVSLALRHGHVIDKWYEEIVTGDSISARNQMQQLLADVQSGIWDGVYVYEIERLARGDTIDQGIVAQTFTYSNTLIYTPMRTYDPANEADSEYFEFGLFMSRREYKTTRRRLLAGREASHSEGKYLGSRRPFGYERVKLKGEKGWSLEIVPQEAAFTRWAADAYLNGVEKTDPETGEITRVQVGAQYIADHFNAMGMRTTCGNEWTAGGIRALLKSPINAGKVQWYKKETKIQMVDGKRQKVRGKSDKYSVVEGRHQAVFNQETVARLHAAFAAHGKSPVNDKKAVISPLIGLVKCSVCGKAMVRTPMYGHLAGVDYIKCSTVKCPTSSAPLTDVEDLIVTALREWIDWAQNDKWPADMRSSTPNLQEDVRAAAQRQLEDLQQRRLRLMELLEKEIYDIPTYTNRNHILNEEIARVQAAISAMPPPVKDKRSAIQALLPQLQNVMDLYSPSLSPATRNQLLRSVIDKVEYTKTRRCYRNENPIDFVELEIYPKIL